MAGREITLQVWNRHDRRAESRWSGEEHPLARVWRGQRIYSPMRRSWAVRWGQETIGRVTLRDLAAGEARVGIYLSPSHVGHGVGRQALHHMSTLCPSLGLSRLRLDVAASNQRAVRCYRAAGFVQCMTVWRDIPVDPVLTQIPADLREYFDLLRPAALWYEFVREVL